MNKKWSIRDYLSPVFLLLSVLLLIFAVATPRTVGDTDTAARKMERRLSLRMARLDYFIDHPQQKLPEDMVIYTYVDDTLQSWRGQFPLYNDDISSRVVVQRITNPRVNLRSPLSYVNEDPEFLNIGPKWYIVKARETDGKRIIAGLEISNSQDESSYGGVNKRLHLRRRFSVRPLTYSGGSPVLLDGRPVFKILYDSLTGVVMANDTLLWLSLLFFLSAAVLFVFRRRTVTRAVIASTGIVLALTAMYFWGRSVQSEVRLFSPMLYAGGSFLFSLGAVILLNLALLLCTVCFYLARWSLWAKLRSKAAIAIASIIDIVCVVLILLNVHMTLGSIVANSGITLELYKLASLSIYTLFVYLSFLSLLCAVPMLLQMLRPVILKLTGRSPRFFSRGWRLAYTVICAVYMVVAMALLGFEKEEDRMEVWAGKLSVDRDVTLELQLLKVERPIAEDAVIGTLAMMEGSEVAIRNRIIDNYLSSEALDYSISVQLVRPGSTVPQYMPNFEQIARNGSPIAEGSFFVGSPTAEGPSRYDGVFSYFTPDGGVIHLLVGIEQKTMPSGKGYARLLGFITPGRTSLPAAYSYSRYQGRDLRTFRGEYPYATRMDDWTYSEVYEHRACHYYRDSYAHFVNVISDDEAMIISRRRIGAFSYVVAMVTAGLLMYALLWCFKPRGQRKKSRGVTYFRSRISWTLMLSLIGALVVMALVSVLFVYRRNEANQQAIMSDRINAIQLLAQNGMRGLEGPDITGSAEFASMIQSVSDNTGSDISVYRTNGHIVMCTNPDALDRLLLGFRIDPEALSRISERNLRYCTIKEQRGWRHYYSMYMPLMDAAGNMAAVLCAPYVEESYDFERDAVMHMMTILTVFLLLFIVARLTESAVLDRVFMPLSMIGVTMRKAGQGLEHISYSRKDEISTLVDAYNRMVDELSESSSRLAQAERDKAWHGMARQVAHEIKNPLTPMKLQIQRLMRLKQKGDPAWKDKFDDVCSILLYHIDVLTETSNEFSTLAKLDTEEHTLLNLDTLLQDEITMFDNRDDVAFTYVGLHDAMVMGPRPQLTRVFVNLLGNAVQAVEGRGGAKVYVSLRKSMREGYYDIVVEDNGPGVSEENIDKLFTPNFTTKSGGSGLGLAISRSILDRCGATIGYSRSFTLQGACFTICYPAASDSMKSEK